MNMLTSEVRDLILLIRAGSTVLHEVKHEAAPAKSYRKKESEPLAHADRIATLFVSKAEGEVAAVSYARFPYHVLIYALTEQQEPAEDQPDRHVYSVRNTVGTLNSGIYPRVATVVAGKSEWTKKLLQK